MSQFKSISLTFLVGLFVVLSIFCLSFSVSAEEVQDNTTVIENIENLNEEVITEEPVQEENTDNESLVKIEFYLKYIFGFILFFVVCFLFWCSYKFLCIFF